MCNLTVEVLKSFKETWTHIHIFFLSFITCGIELVVEIPLRGGYLFNKVNVMADLIS